MEHEQHFSPKIVFGSHISTILGWIFFLVLCLPFNVQAGEVTLAWDPPSTEYGGFILSYGTTSGNYSSSHDVGRQTTYTVSSLNAGQTYYFAVKAYNPTRVNESPYSNQVVAKLPSLDSTPPASPKHVLIQ